MIEQAFDTQQGAQSVTLHEQAGAGRFSNGFFSSTMLYFLAAGSSSAGMFLISLLIGRTLGPAGLGAFSLSITTATLCVLVADLGIDSLVMRSCAAKSPPLQLRDLFTTKLASSALVSGLTLALFAVNDISATAVYAAGTLLIVPRAMSGAMESLLKTRQRRMEVVGIAAGSAATSVATVVLLLGMGASLPELLGGLVVVETGRCLFLAWRTEQCCKGIFHVAIPGFGMILTVLKQSLPFAALGLISYAGGRADILVLGMFRGKAEAGVYAAADRLLTGGNLVAFALYGTALPALSSIRHRLHHRRTTRRVLGTALVVGIMGVVFLDLLGPALLRWTYQFADSDTVLAILAFSLPGLLSYTVLGAALFSLHCEREALAVLLSANSIGLMLNMVLVPLHGATGAAIACVVTETATATGYAWLYFFRKVRP